MLEAGIASLITPELEEAFRTSWSASKEDAEAEARQIVTTLAEFDSTKETLPEKQIQVDALVARIVLGLVGEKPDLHSWLEAIAKGSFELRPPQDYAHSAQLKSRARLLSRQQGNLDKIEPLRRAWAAEADASQDAVRLIAASALLKEMRKNVAAKAALGPAWPLMVAVNENCSAEEKRTLHRFGNDPSLISAIAAGARLGIQRFARSRLPAQEPATSRAADWRRSLPPGADARTYFSNQDATSAERATSLEAVEKKILEGPKPSFLVEMEVPIEKRPSQTMILNLLLAEPAEESHTFSRAVRALAREQERENLVKDGSPLVAAEDFRLQVWLRDWAQKGGDLPARLPARLYSYLEEEVCLAFETLGDDWPGCRRWREHGVIGDEPSKTRPTKDYLEAFGDAAFTWCAPPRVIDRIEI